MLRRHCSLEEACRRANAPVADVVATLDAALRVPPIKEDCHWLTCSLSELADHITRTHHLYTRNALSVVAALAQKVSLRHGINKPKVVELAGFVEALETELLTHMAKEEQILFPALKLMEMADTRGDAARPAFPGALVNPIRHMMEEHDDAGELLKAIRALTNNYQAPEGACVSHKALYSGLKEFERDSAPPYPP